MERMRDDPFYLADDRHAQPKVEDVDNIPVVRLDDLPPLPQSTGTFWERAADFGTDESM
jgi:AP-3 complex subunit delta